MKPNSKKIDIAKQYTDLLESIIGQNLISVFLFGSVVRSEDTNRSDIDIMTIVRDYLSLDQIEILGRSGRFNEIRGYGIFEEKSTIATLYEKALQGNHNYELVNAIREWVIEKTS